MNKDYAKQGGSNHFFGTELHYDYGFTNVEYSGNISGITWRSKTDNQWRSYGYNHDGMNRLLKADFTQNNGGWNTSTGIDFSTKMGDGINPASAYDENGNILGMTQMGLKSGGSMLIDKLDYSYFPNSNKLMGVIDQVNDPQSTLGDFKEANGQSNNDYNYDSNGNIIQDLNKNILAGGITYNHLNLPEKITIGGKGTIQFLYNANGDKIRKIVTDNTVTPAKITTTDYYSGYVYQNDTLQFYGNEAGRTRIVNKAGMAPQEVYDYFLKDHLGNVRMVLTEQTDFSMYLATMETPNAAKETALFSNIDNTRSPKPIGYPQDGTTSKNEYVVRLNAHGTGKKIGPSLVLRVMAGDTVQIGTKAFYKSNSPQDKNDHNLLPEDMVADLVRAFGGNVASNDNHSYGGNSDQRLFNTSFYNNDYQRLKERNSDGNSSNKPKAYLNYVLFNEQFKLVDENSGVKQVKNEPDQLQELAIDRTVMTQSGFLYVYTSNESAQDVYFDNVFVMHTTGPILEETHYYPFGLTMAGISSNALKSTNYPANKMLYNGKELQDKEFNDGSGLEWYAYGMREYDHQIARFTRVDPLTNDYVELSPYQYAGNSPIGNIDLDGLESKRAYQSWDKVHSLSHTYSNGQKIYLIDNYWTSMEFGGNDYVFQFYNREEGRWQEFTPRSTEDDNRQRAKALSEVSNGLGIGYTVLLSIGSGLTNNAFALGVTYTSAGMGVADAGVQMAFSSEKGFLNKLKDVNITSVLATTFFKNPFGGAVIGTGFDFRLKDKFKHSLFGDPENKKSIHNFIIESLIIGIAGKYTEVGLKHLGVGTTAGARAMVRSGLKRSEIAALGTVAATYTWFQMALLSNLFATQLEEFSKVEKEMMRGSN